jgi:hypothetical protein
MLANRPNTACVSGNREMRIGARPEFVQPVGREHFLQTYHQLI